MAGSVRAKFRVWNVAAGSLDAEGKPYSMRVQLSAVYDPNPESENHTFWRATPSATIDMYIDNRAAFDAFESGKEYVVDFTPVE